MIAARLLQVAALGEVLLPEGVLPAEQAFHHRRKTGRYRLISEGMTPLPKYNRGKKKTKIPREFTVENHGSICSLRPLTDSGRAWVNKNIGADMDSNHIGRRLFWSRASSIKSSPAFANMGWWCDEQGTTLLGHLSRPRLRRR